MPNHHYNPHNKSKATFLRKNSTKSEIILWSVVLRARKMGYQCQRQRPIDRYIADFYFPEVKMLLEVDGYSHEFEEKIEYDRRRDKRLAQLGYETLRIKDQEVYEELDNVVARIEQALEQRRQELGLQKPERKKRS